MELYIPVVSRTGLDSLSPSILSVKPLLLEGIMFLSESLHHGFPEGEYSIFQPFPEIYVRKEVSRDYVILSSTLLQGIQVLRLPPLYARDLVT